MRISKKKMIWLIGSFRNPEMVGAKGKKSSKIIERITLMVWFWPDLAKEYAKIGLDITSQEIGSLYSNGWRQTYQPSFFCTDS